MDADAPTDVFPASAVPGAPAKPVGDASSLLGRTLGRFAIVDKLGHGGSGDVFRAEQIGLNRTVVVKVLRREHAATVNRVERFLREAQLASRLDHPYAAHIYAFGAQPDGVLWIAMEYVRGATLDELIVRRGAIPPAVFAPLFARLCEVVHTAHELGIVHRDIKGSNVMVIERAGQLLPKLLDFGIAKLDFAEAEAQAEVESDVERAAVQRIAEVSDLTLVGATLGSPHYMAPEQWSNAADVDARADIYALGALAYRCISGELPFRGTDWRALAAQHQMEAPPLLPTTVPAAVADAILRALAKRPAERWATALAFGEAVRFAVGAAAPEPVPIFDPYSRDMWLRAGPQPIADAVARIVAAGTTVECDAALRDLVAITCRWLAVLALSGTPAPTTDVRARARGVVGHDEALPWLELARAADAMGTGALPGLTAALAGSAPLAALAGRLDDHGRPRTAHTLAADIADAADALRPIEPLLAYQLVVGRDARSAESWIGTRRREHERVLVWGDALADGDVALLDAAGKVVARLTPLAQVVSPLPSAEPEMFLLWRSARGRARLVAAPWGFEHDDDAASEVMAILSTEDSDTAHDAGDELSPYPGLSPYGVDDAERFVGREREIEALTNRLVRAPLLAVLGPSGAGKSSFVHAGVVPRLVEAGYRVVTLRPGRHPMHALAALPTVSSDSHDDAATAARLRELGESAARGLVVVIDQLEELVTLCSDAGERTRFAEVLAAAADSSRAPVRVVVTLRDDFAAVVESESALRGRFDVFVLGTPLPEALHRIVVEPARRAGVTVDATVVADMVAEVAGRPASLPLLSFTAAQLWRTRDAAARTITRDAYDAIGGVAGALSSYADQVYDSFARKDQQVVRALFARLVASDGTRIPAPRAELEQLSDTKPVLAHLIDARLLVVREDDGGRGQRGVTVDLVEIIHECLAERWERLAHWRREDAADRALVGDLRAAARRWFDTRSADTLWRGEPLSELRKLVARSPALTDAERAFAAASDAADRRARRVRRGAVAVAMAALAAVAIVMAYLGVVAKRSRDDSEQSAIEARASARLADDRLTASLVAQGRRELNDNQDLQALAYFAEALRRGADSPSLRLMIAYADRGRGFERHVYRGMSTALVSDGSQFLCGGMDAAIHLFAASGEATGMIPTHLDVVQSLLIGADGAVVAAGPRAGGGGIVVADAARRAVVDELAVPFRPWMARLGPAPGEVAVVEAAGFHVFDRGGHELRSRAWDMLSAGNPEIDATGRWVAFDYAGAVQVFDLATMTSRTLPTGWNSVYSSDDGSRRAVFDRDGALHITAADGTLLRTLPLHDTRTAMAVFSTDTSELVVVTEHQVDLYGSNGSATDSLVTDADVTTAAMRGGDLWLADLQGTNRHFRNGRLIGSLPSHMTEVQSTALAGDAIATVSTDTTLVIAAADYAQVRFGAMPCRDPSYGPIGPLVLYACGDRTILYLGERRVGDMPLAEPVAATYSRELGRAAAATVDRVAAFDRDGKLVAESPPGPGHAGPLAYADADHLYVIGGDALLRWRIGSDEWTRVAGAPHATAVAVTPAGPIVGFHDGTIALYAGDHDVRARLSVGVEIGALDVSPDGRWLLATMTNGDSVVIDIAAATVARKLTAGEALGGQAVFDDSGELVLRLVRAAISVTERDTGVDLLVNLDLMRTVMGAHGLADGRIELDSNRPAVVDIARDQRPRDAIIHAIECRVPLRVVDSSLAPADIPPGCNDAVVAGER